MSRRDKLRFTAIVTVTGIEPGEDQQELWWARTELLPGEYLARMWPRIGASKVADDDISVVYFEVQR